MWKPQALPAMEGGRRSTLKARSQLSRIPLSIYLQITYPSICHVMTITTTGQKKTTFRSTSIQARTQKEILHVAPKLGEIRCQSTIRGRTGIVIHPVSSITSFTFCTSILTFTHHAFSFTVDDFDFPKDAKKHIGAWPLLYAGDLLPPTVLPTSPYHLHGPGSQYKPNFITNLMNTFGKIVIKDLEKSEQLPTYGYPIVMEKYSILSELLDVDRYPLRNYITRRRALLFKFSCGLYSLALVRNSTNLAENIPKKFFSCDDDSATLWQAMMAYTVSTFRV